MSWSDIRALAQGARGADENGYRAEFVQLIDMAKSLAP
jgi:Ca-activated chloride channel family protein